MGMTASIIGERLQAPPGSCGAEFRLSTPSPAVIAVSTRGGNRYAGMAVTPGGGETGSPCVYGSGESR